MAEKTNFYTIKRTCFPYRRAAFIDAQPRIEDYPNSRFPLKNTESQD